MFSTELSLISSDSVIVSVTSVLAKKWVQCADISDGTKTVKLFVYRHEREEGDYTDGPKRGVCVCMCQDRCVCSFTFAA